MDDAGEDDGEMAKVVDDGPGVGEDGPGVGEDGPGVGEDGPGVGESGFASSAGEEGVNFLK